MISPVHISLSCTSLLSRGLGGALMIFFLIFLGVPSASLSQTQPAPSENEPTEPASSAEPAKRLQQMEATYQLNLRKIHAPLLQEYLRRLDLLQQQLQAQNRTEHAAQVSQEAKKIREIIATTGILPITRPTPAPSTDLALDANSNPNREAPALSLQAADAISPAAVTAEARKALPLGSIAWNVPKLDPGTYDILLIFAAASLTEDEPLLLTLASKQLISKLPADQATDSDDTFRLFSLGQLQIDTPLADQTLTLQNGNPSVPRLRIRNVLFVRSQPNSSN